MANSLRITELDFDQIKQNLRTFLQSQTEFTDYDFEGSGLSILIDVLAYNTHYNAFYANMAMNELFLDSAVKRESVVSLAKMLNYVPRSVRSSSALLNLTVNGVTGSPASLPIAAYTAFNSTINGAAYTFYNIEPKTITPVAGVYSYTGLEVFEGTYVSNKFDVSTTGPSNKYQIPNSAVDTTTIRVTVQDSATSSTSTVYTKFDGDITRITELSTVYFIDQNTSGFYEVYFGDGILGKRLSSGNRVTIEYLVSNGTEANISDKVTQSFTIVGTIGGYSNVTLVVSSKSTSGQDQESIDEIRFNAPKYATAQNRLITKYDYEAFMKRNYNYIDAVSIWGGEDNDPPQYGKVFLSVLPKAGQNFTTTRKNTIITDIKDQRALAITPVFVDPEIFYINVYSVIKYNPNKTTESASSIQTAVQTVIEDYFAQNLGSFGQDFSQSKLLAAIDATKASITSNVTEITLQSRLDIASGVGSSQKIKIGNKLEEHSVSSSRFYYNQVGAIYPAQIKDIPDVATVILNGTYRRTGVLITCTFDQEHGLTTDEHVTLSFSGSSISGVYSINAVESPYKITVISIESGNDSGSCTLNSENRGRLVVYNPTNETTLNNNIGFISYDSGLIQISDLTVYGYLVDQTDVRLYFNLTKDSQDILISRNQIIQLDDSSANTDTNRQAGISLSTIAIPK